AVLNFDLGQAGVVEHFGEFTHEASVEPLRLRRSLRLSHGLRGLLGILGLRFSAHAFEPSFANKAAASIASKYDVAPKPAMTPFAAWPTNETCRNSSRVAGLERWVSITGIAIALIASCSATEVWV